MHDACNSLSTLFAKILHGITTEGWSAKCWSVSHECTYVCVCVVYARLASVCAYASVKLQKEYRTPSTVIVSLARVRLEPSPHLAFGLAGTSPPDRFYTFVSPTLANVRARSCSLPRSLAPRHVDSAHGQFHHGREDRSFFFLFFLFFPSSPDIRGTHKHTRRRDPGVAPFPREGTYTRVLRRRKDEREVEGRDHSSAP